MGSKRRARWIQARLAGFGIESRLEIIHTTGDKITDVALSKVGTKGLFTKELEDDLAAGRVHCCVHSLKDFAKIKINDQIEHDVLKERK